MQSDKTIAAQALGVEPDAIRAVYNFGTHLIAVAQDGHKHRVDAEAALQAFEPDVAEAEEAFMATEPVDEIDLEELDALMADEPESGPVKDPTDEGDDEPEEAGAWVIEDPAANISEKVLTTLQQHFDGPEAVAAASDSELLKLPSIGPAALKAIRAFFGPHEADDGEPGAR